jgi:hypothetical protein
VLEHGLGVCIRDEEGDVVVGDRLATKDHERFCTLHHETRELVAEDGFDLVCLLDLNAHTDRVDRRLNENALILVTRDSKRGKKNFLGSSDMQAKF